jgi:AraC-like DNA-binding protein
LPENEKSVYVKTLLSELIVFLSVSSGEQIQINEGELGARVIRYLNENLTRDMNLDTIARRFFVSKYYLCRAFKKHNGVSVHGYINHKRIMYAKQLIEQGDTASGAAYKVGFGDYSAFYRAYVKIIGKSPTA